MSIKEPMLKQWIMLSAIGMVLGGIGQVGSNDAPRQKLAEGLCSVLKPAAAAIPGNGPMILLSYPDLQGEDLATRALQDVGFVYDNALAGIALSACGAPKQARRGCVVVSGCKRCHLQGRTAAQCVSKWRSAKQQDRIAWLLAKNRATIGVRIPIKPVAPQAIWPGPCCCL